MKKLEQIRVKRKMRKQKIDTIERNLTDLIYNNNMIKNNNIFKYFINKNKELNKC